MTQELKDRVDKQLSNYKSGKITSKKNTETVLKYYDFCKARNLSDARMTIILDKIKLACNKIILRLW